MGGQSNRAMLMSREMLWLRRGFGEMRVCPAGPLCWKGLPSPGSGNWEGSPLHDQAFHGNQEENKQRKNLTGW